MFMHTCTIDDMKIIGARPNPLNAAWSEWTAVVCVKCKKVYEWQHHSEEQMHGGDLEITALPSPDYLQHCYGLDRQAIEAIMVGRRKVRRYDRYRNEYKEESF